MSRTWNDYWAYIKQYRDFNRVDESDEMLCDRCGTPTVPKDGPGEFYLVTYETWRMVRGNAKYLCVGCLERALGRRLCPSDFNDTEVNAVGPWMTDRLVEAIRGTLRDETA